jgi:glycosyltransferase involved in cell wall biosynthesis
MPKLIRITTAPLALRNLIAGQMRFMVENGFDVKMISADGEARNEIISNEKCEHIVVPMTRQITPFADLKCLFQLIKIFKKEKPDIVHSHTPKAGLLGMLAAKFTSVPVRVHTLAGMPLMTTTGFKKKLLKFIEQVTYWAAVEVWPNSFSLKNYIVENNMIKSAKTHVIGKGSSNGIDLSKYNKAVVSKDVVETIKEKYNIDNQKFNLLFVGRVVRDKGIAELLDAFEKVEKNFPNVNLILVGDFEENLDPLPAKYLDILKNNAKVKLTGWVGDVAPFYQLANLAVFPSYREGFPNALLQAGAFELPIVCSDIMGNIDLIDESFGQIFQVRNAENLYEKITFALNNEAEVKKRAAALLAHIHQQYETETIKKSILEKYKQLLN